MKTVLIIEDEVFIRENLAEVLEVKGFKTYEAANGKQGIMQALKNHPDLIICDIMMPEMNGYDVLKFIRQNNKLTNTPFIFLTAKTERQDTRMGMSLGADDYLTKPFTTKELLDAVNIRFKRQEEMNAELEKKIKSITQQLNQVTAHEMNTPLNGILGFSDLLINHFDSFSKDKVIELLHHVKSSGERLLRTSSNILLYNSILTYKQSENAEKKLTAGHADISEEKISAAVTEIAEKYNRFQDLALAIEQNTVAMNTENVLKVITELSDNAFKFSPDNTKVSVKTIQSDDENYVIEVFNKGIGMKQTQLTKIGPFRQFERQKLSQQGNGLGLFIVQKLLELNAGKLIIESKPDVYFSAKAVFKIYQGN